MKNIQDLSHDSLYLVALSGGADSVALTLMMAEHGLRIHALHCNFHLRGQESDRDECFVRNFCLRNSIPLDVKHFDTFDSARKHRVSIEMEARSQRYEWFARRAKELGAEAICVAHHKDDQAETLLLNLIRGTGLRGLAAMSPDRVVNGLRILRPLLDVSRKDILSYLQNRNQTFVTDSTNLEREALRNRIRLDVIPLLQQLNPSITECLARTAENVSMELDNDSSERYYFQWLSPLGFSRQQILDIHTRHQRATKDSGLIWHSPTHTLLLDRGQWVLREKAQIRPTALPELVTTILPQGETPTPEELSRKTTAFIDADRLEGGLIIRYVQQGDRFRPFGMSSGTQLVSDYLTNRKVNLLDKQSQLIAIDSHTRDIVWVAGREIDNRYRITDTTRRIMRIEIPGH